jgi:hypothetical protein
MINLYLSKNILIKDDKGTILIWICKSLINR